MKSLGDQVKEFRSDKRWNTTQLAKAVGTSRQNIESLEASGNRIPKYLGRLASVIGRPVDLMLAVAGLHNPNSYAGALAEQTGAYLPGFEALSVPVLATAASMGAGEDVGPDDVVVGRMTLSPQWVTKTLRGLSDIKHLRFIHGYGDSMEPTFFDGDILLIDAGVPAIKVDGIYVLEANDRLYIKRVRQRIDGSFEISSDNPTVKTVDVLDGSRPVSVKGRVVWVWNGKKI